MKRLGALLALLFVLVPLHAWAADVCTPTLRTLQLDALALAPERVTVDVYLPGDYARSGAHRYPVLYTDDGQDMPAVGLVSTLTALFASGGAWAHAIESVRADDY